MGRERDWQRARERDLMRVRSEAQTLPRPPKKPKPLSSKQSHYLATLQEKAGIPYTGDSLTAAEASREIQRLLALTPERPKHAVERRQLSDRVEHLEQDVKALTERLIVLERQT